MKVNQTAENLKKFAKEGYKVAPVAARILSDVSTPIETLKAIREVSGDCFLFESVEGGEKWARYSFLGYDPSAEITVKDGVFTFKDKSGEKKTPTDNPNGEIRRILKEYSSPKIAGFPTFTGGLVGYFSYEYFRYGEKAPFLKSGDFGDCRLFLFDKVIAYDNVAHKIVLIVNVPLCGDIDDEYKKAIKELNKMKEIVLNGCSSRREKPYTVSPFVAKYSEEEYSVKVKKAKDYIFEGDIFQCVPSNRWTAETDGSLLNAYRLLRTINPSPYMIYMSFGDSEIAGASPETLVKVTDGVAQTFPIAGSRKRGKTREEDLSLEKELASDEKEGAEHDMLVDLGRNDLGKICKFGSVRVVDYKKIYRFSHIMHLTSTVIGELAEGKDAIDALAATLPAGTLSGAPKLRAVEIINELEDGEPRGVYGGSVGYFDFTGNSDFCIAIRTAVRKGSEVSVRAGGGIVSGSVPHFEYLETVNKSAAVREAVQGATEVDL